MIEKMIAIVIHSPGDYRIEKVSVPRCPEKGLLIKVIACGLCGSDLRTLSHGHKDVTLPWIIGHEVSGEVVKIGKGYHGPYKKGDILAVAPLVYCGECEFCINGQYEFCDNIRELAKQWYGGFAEYMAIPEESLMISTIQKVPQDLDPVIAAVSEPVSSCINAQEKGEVGFEDTVVIIGAGPIGCIHTILAKAKGAKQVIIADVFDDRLKMCEPFGPDVTINPLKVNLIDEVKMLTNGKGANVIINANSVGETQVQAVEMAKKGGRILLFGGLPKDSCKPGIDTNIIHYRGLHLIGTFAFAPRHYHSALSLMKSGKIPGDKLVTHKLPLSDFIIGVRLAKEGKTLKVVFLPDRK